MFGGSGKGSGFAAAWIGSLIGAVVGGLPGLFLGALLGDASSSGFDEIGTGITYASYGALAGAAIGASAGCAMALGARGHRNALGTGAALGMLLIVGWVLWGWVLIDAADLVAVGLPLLGLLVAPLAARALAMPSADERTGVPDAEG